MYMPKGCYNRDKETHGVVEIRGLFDLKILEMCTWESRLQFDIPGLSLSRIIEFVPISS